jgi:hypothetical protein
MAYIEKNGSPVNTTTYNSIEEAIADFTKPAWAGAKSTEITMINETTFKASGLIYNLVNGDNPTMARREARAAQSAKPTAKREYKGATWLSREMDRKDSDY